MQRIRRQGRLAYTEPFKFDHNPLFACEVGPPDEDGLRQVACWMAFDPQYGPSHESQIEWHVKRGTPGAETWEVGEPVRV